MILDALHSVPDMSSRLALGGDKEALARAWIGGRSAPESAEAAGMSDRDEAARFIDESLGRYATWGIAAFTRIAAFDLGLEPQGLPPRMRHLAEVVGHGVPRPEAGWAIRLGVATRRAAIRWPPTVEGSPTLRRLRSGPAARPRERRPKGTGRMRTRPARRRRPRR